MLTFGLVLYYLAFDITIFFTWCYTMSLHWEAPVFHNILFLRLPNLDSSSNKCTNRSRSVDTSYFIDMDASAGHLKVLQIHFFSLGTPTIVVVLAVQCNSVKRIQNSNKQWYECGFHWSSCCCCSGWHHLHKTLIVYDLSKHVGDNGKNKGSALFWWCNSKRRWQWHQIRVGKKWQTAATRISVIITTTRVIWKPFLAKLMKTIKDHLPWHK